ncbi:unnamed protein product, partial [marine sediment metagenome]
ATPGTNGDTLNPATAGQLVMFPNTSGPGQQGSVYASGVAVTEEARNNLSADAYALWVTWAESFLITLGTAGWSFQLGLPSRPFVAGDPGADPPIPDQEALPFRPFVQADARVPLTKIRSRRLDTRC